MIVPGSLKVPPTFVNWIDSSQGQCAQNYRVYGKFCFLINPILVETAHERPHEPPTTTTRRAVSKPSIGSIIHGVTEVGIASPHIPQFSRSPSGTKSWIPGFSGNV